jgi:EmrB/QacA subfamily drug resistance transporter
MTVTDTLDTAPPVTAPAQSTRSIYVAIIGLMLGMFMAMLDNLIVGTALPTIVGDLGGIAHLSWVVTAYALATAASTPIWGKLGDLYGRKGMFMSAIVVFLAGSALTGLSQNMDQLIGFRALQGLGAGGLMVGAMAIIGDLVPPRERGRFQGLIGGMMPLAFVGGPLLGGFLTDNLSWRWAFYVNIPLGVLALLVTGLGMRLHTRHVKAKIDYIGAFLLTVGVVALTLVASWGGTEYPWRSRQIIALAVVSVVSLAGFVFAEGRVAEPILPPRLFRSRNFTIAQLLSFLIGAAMFGAVNFLPQYMQYVQGASATTSGLLLLPLMFGMLAIMLLTGQLITRNGRYRIYPIIGGAVLTAGMLLLVLLKVDTSTVMSSGLTVVAGLGMGFIMQNTMLVTQNSVELRDMGAASGSVTLFRTVGGSLGVALLGSIYTSRLKDSLAERLGSKAGHEMTSGGGIHATPAVLHTLPAPVRDAFEAGVTSGLHGTVVGGAVLAFAGFVFAWFIREVPLRSGASAPAPSGGAGTGGRHATRAGREPVRAGREPVGAPREPVGAPREPVRAGAAAPYEPIGGHETRGVIRGVVRRAGGAPAGDTTLTLIDTRGHQVGRTTTRSDGRYALSTPGRGTYVLIAGAGERAPQAATLVVGHQPVDFDLTLTGSAGLAGVVRDAAGNPVRDARVVVTDVRGEVVATGTTDAGGTYGFPHVAAGPYTLAVSSAAHRPTAVPVLVGDERTRQDVELTAARIHGVIRAEGRGPLPDARVVLSDAAGNVVRVTTTGPDGEYTFAGLAGGPYTVTASGYPPVAGEVILNGRDEDGFDLLLGYPADGPT